MNYLPRIADDLLREHLEAMGAVLIQGPKWCGKTTTAEQQAKSVLRMQDTDNRAQYLTIAAHQPSFLLEGNKPRLIDEWQDAPVLWDAIRQECDKLGSGSGLFILTGSTVVDEKKIMHSGTGRISRIKMFPMSLWESGESNGTISLKEMFDHPQEEVFCHSDLTIDELLFVACRGGWPHSLQGKTDKQKLLVAQNYVESVYESDISRVDGVQKNPKLARTLLCSYARNISTLAKATTIMADITTSGKIDCSRNTYETYIAALEKLFVISDLDAWCPAIRSKTAIQSSPKRSFCDPSIAATLLGVTPESLKMDFLTFGFLFEQLCIRDLRAYSQQLGGEVEYYHDRYGLEADIVLHLRDGRSALIECKLGGNGIEDGAKHLLKIKQLIHEKNQTEKQMPIREPDLLIVLTGGEYGFTTKDGVKVIPLACLRP